MIRILPPSAAEIQHHGDDVESTSSPQRGPTLRQRLTDESAAMHAYRAKPQPNSADNASGMGQAITTFMARDLQLRIILPDMDDPITFPTTDPNSTW